MKGAENLGLHCSLVPGWLLECRTPLLLFLLGLSTLALWDSPLRTLSVHMNHLSLLMGMCTTKKRHLMAFSLLGHWVIPGLWLVLFLPPGGFLWPMSRKGRGGS